MDRAALRYDGAWWRRFAELGCVYGPEWWKRGSPPVFAAMIFAIARAQRQAVRRNQRQVRGGGTWLREHLAAYRVFAQFARSLTEGMEQWGPHPKPPHKLRRLEHFNGHSPEEGTSRDGVGEVRFAVPCPTPEIQVVLRGIKRLGRAEGGVVSGRYLETVEGKVSIGLEATQQMDQLDLARVLPLFSAPGRFAFLRAG